MCVREREFLVGISPVCVVCEQNRKGEKNEKALCCKRRGVWSLDLAVRGRLRFRGLLPDVSSNTVM